MRPSNVTFAVVGVALQVLCAAKFAQGQAEAEPASATSVTAFAAKMPVGYLEVPLGTVVRATGVVIDGDTTGSKADTGKTLLRVTTVNGKDLRRPIVFEFLRAPKSLQKPTPGEKFDYYLHEYGHFDGEVMAPKEFGIDELETANDGFHYQGYVAIHALKAALK
jgi:hypothetical protein